MDEVGTGNAIVGDENSLVVDDEDGAVAVVLVACDE